ncbi:MAG: hypothetical protein Q8O56_14975 [Solirubrobacteraceae bacterium]|nr:hypothetical protein [Solirubrobacteraceae bacterium]
MLSGSKETAGLTTAHAARLPFWLTSLVDPARQVIRYTVPGGLAVLFAVATYATFRVLWGVTLTEIEALTRVTTSVTAIAASVPVGFVIYQVYYWSYSPLVRRRYVTRDRGAEVLKGLDDDVLARLRTLLDARLDVDRSHRQASTGLARALRLLELDHEAMRSRYPASADGSRPTNAELRAIYRENWFENWDVFRSLLDLLHTHGHGEELKREFVSLSDIYHSLGASRAAVAAGWLVAFVYLPVAHHADFFANPAASVLGAVITASSTLAIAYVLHRTRHATWKTAVGSIQFGLRWCVATSDGFQAVLRASQPASEHASDSGPALAPLS